MSYYSEASLVMIPSGVKDGKVYSAKPVDGSGDLTFSRGSDIEATRVAANGYIEKAKVNLLLQSNTFSTTWSNAATTETGGQAGYDGSSDAWRLVENTALSYHSMYQSSIHTGLSTFSVYAKTNGRDLQLRVNSIGLGKAFVNYDLSAGTIGLSGGSSLIDSFIESVGGGWHRCSFSLSDSGTYGFDIIVITDASTSTEIEQYTGDGTSGIYIQDAQLNYGLVAQDYQETTTTSVITGITNDMPRLDYSGGASCPSLLMEGERRNLVTQSEYYGAWTTIGTATFTANYGASPEGVNNAYRFEATSGTRGGKFVTISVLSGTTYTLSIYAKSLSGTQKIRIGADDGCSTPQGAQTFDVTTEWQRFSITIASTQTSWNLFLDNVESGTACTGTYLDADLLIYGFQCEAGSNSTSYIPNYGLVAGATRTADAAYKTGISSLIGQTEGTLFVEVDYTNTGESQTYITISDGTINNRITLSYSLTLNCLNAFARVGGSTQALMTSATSPANGIKKIAVAYKLNDYRFYINGTEVAVDSSALVPTCSRIDVGSLLATGNESSVKQAILFPTRLSNSDLAALTA